MSSQAKLKAQPRQDTGKSHTRKMRAAGRVPAVVYGHGDTTRMVTLDAHELDLLFKRIHVENTVIELDIDGERAPVRTLVREVQSHAFKPLVLHVDFQMLHAGERIHVAIPIHLVGTAVGTRSGGVLMQTVTDLEVWCMPDSIPESIEIDISHLEINDAVHLSDITLPEGVSPMVEGERTICSITPPLTGSTAATAADEEE